MRSVTLRGDRDEIISGDAAGKVTVWDLGGNGRSSENYMGGSNRSKTSKGDTGYLHQVQPGKGTTGGCLLQTSIQAVDISEDSRTFAAVSNHGTVYVWDPISQNTGNFLENRPITKFRAHPSGSYCLHAKISPDCRHLCTTGSDGSAKLFDTTTWELAHNLQAHSKWVWDGKLRTKSSASIEECCRKSRLNGLSTKSTTSIAKYFILTNLFSCQLRFVPTRVI